VEQRGGRKSRQDNSKAPRCVDQQQQQQLELERVRQDYVKYRAIMLPSVRLSVCPSVRLFHRSTAATAAGGFAAKRRAGRIDTLICGRRRSAANAGSVMLSAEEGADLLVYPVNASATTGGSIAEWLACWTQAQKGLGSNRSRDAVG